MLSAVKVTKGCRARESKMRSEYHNYKTTVILLQAGHFLCRRHSPSILGHDFFDYRMELLVRSIILFETILTAKVAVDPKLFALGASEVATDGIGTARRCTGTFVGFCHDGGEWRDVLFCFALLQRRQMIQSGSNERMVFSIERGNGGNLFRFEAVVTLLTGE